MQEVRSKMNMQPEPIPEVMAQATTRKGNRAGTRFSGDDLAHWAWTEPSVWNPKMLATLENNEVRGGKWHSLIDKVYHLENLFSAYREVAANKGAPGVDHVTIEDFAAGLIRNTNRLHDQLQSGEYRPQAIRRVNIPKPGTTETRPLGIPNVMERLIQQAISQILTPMFDPDFSESSYGYRPKRSASGAIKQIQRTIREGYRHCVDMDLSKFFDRCQHDGLLARVARKVDDKRLLKLIGRFLRAGVIVEGQLQPSHEGVMQGSPLSPLLFLPLLSNLFMHYAFDEWLRRNYPSIQIARYADDAVVHARSQHEAETLLEAIRERLAECGLELHPVKTKIVYCKDDDRRGTHEHTSFDFLGYTFRPRRAKNRWGKLFISFLPGVSKKAANSIRATIRSWRIGATRSNQSLEEIAKFVNPFVRGWVNYYGRYYPSALTPVLRSLERSLVYWVRRKFKRLRRHQRNAVHWLGKVAQREPKLFALWEQGIRPATGQ